MKSEGQLMVVLGWREKERKSARDVEMPGQRTVWLVSVIITTSGTSHRGRLQRLERLEDIADGEWTREYKGRSRSWDNVAPSASSELNRNWGQRLSSVNVAEPSLEPASLLVLSSSTL
ncbi:hypothetical protein K0M31_000131 [Melipona bicolor]|uniref:Uncharacterized protein n=1 Tax=Melipona bicolor TaxID=60889 RepID=A0AA40KWH0_9HYME|nr:hypothetical protein K0M31_000131 [Melipona bicolor]